jgi:hypothetical protein
MSYILQKEFLLLCGPISQDMYNLAVQEVQLMSKPSNSTSSSNASTANSITSGTNSSSNSMKHLLLLDRLGVQATRIQIDTLMEDIHARDDYIGGVEDKLRELQSLACQQQQQLEDCREALAGLEEENGALLLYKERYLASRGAVNSSASFTALEQQKFVKLTSLARGYIARRRVKKLKMAKLADSTGVLVALENTKQGS